MDNVIKDTLTDKYLDYDLSGEKVWADAIETAHAFTDTDADTVLGQINSLGDLRYAKVGRPGDRQPH